MSANNEKIPVLLDRPYRQVTFVLLVLGGRGLFGQLLELLGMAVECESPDLLILTQFLVRHNSTPGWGCWLKNPLCPVLNILAIFQDLQ